MTTFRTLTAAATAAFTASLLLACNSVGDGTRPVSAAILPAGETAGAASTTAFVCQTKRLDMILTFNNGEKGSYFNSTRWVSSNPAVVQISNNDIAVPSGGGSFFVRGTLVPQGAGTATITADYLSFHQSIDVVVDTIGNLRVLPVVTNAKTGDPLNIAPGSFGDLNLMGTLAGVETNLDASWSIVVPDTTVAGINVLSGAVSAVAESAGTVPPPSTKTLTARATLLDCPSSFANTFDATVNVSSLLAGGLVLSQEFASSNDLVLGTTEKLNVVGSLHNGATQELSLQSTYTITDPPVAPSTTGTASTSIGQLSGTLYGYLQAVKASAAQSVVASFGTNAVASNALSITPVAATLNSVQILPKTASIAIAKTGNFTATGSFTAAAPSTANFTQPVSRHVTFTSSDTTQLVLGTSSGTVINPLAGLALVLASATSGNMPTVTAASTSATAQVANDNVATVTITP